jgi:hypothetical protein
VRWWVPRDGALPGRIRATCRGTIWGRAEGRSWSPGRPRRPDFDWRTALVLLTLYLIAVGIFPYLPFLAGLSPLLSLAAIVAGVLILTGR